MPEIPFFAGLWFSFFIICSSSFFVFFASSFKMLIMASALALTGISFQILTTDFFRATNYGQLIVIFLWFLFSFQSLSLNFILKKQPMKNTYFFVYPFLAFITMAISLDLITFLFGLILFGYSFIMLETNKRLEIKKILSKFQINFVSFLTFSYGLACLYTREGTIQLKDLYLKLNNGTWDSLTTLGICLLILAILIEIYAIIPIISKRK